MSNERDELAEVISNFRDDWYKTPRKPPAGIDRVEAEAILAAGYRKPRTITTVEELDALPEGAVLLDRDGLALQKEHVLAGWSCANGTRFIEPGMVIEDGAPLTVLREGDS